MHQTLRAKIEKFLLQVQKPSQYTGGEQNSVIKNHSSLKLKCALAFPDTYHIGMSHLGFQILYGLLNDRPDIAAERVFAPWLDMEKLMRQYAIPLFTLETHTAVKDFDIIGFSLQHELCYTTVLNMLDLAGVPLRCSERTESDPLVIAGGPCAFTPEPLADFIDLFVIGDGEEKIIELVDEVISAKHNRIKRWELLKQLVIKYKGFYAPSLYEVTYHGDNTIKQISPKISGLPSVIHKATVEDLDQSYYPLAPIIPFGEAVHERINLEIMRGCPNACRFCVSTRIKQPLRYRSVDKLLTLAETIYEHTGYDEISLLSLSSGEYPWLDELLVRLNGRFKSRRVGISLPSLRIDERLKNLPATLKTVRKAGFTIAPEAGCFFLRQIIDKQIEDQDIFASVQAAYEQGWNLVKLYFMIGLPGETDDDIKAIVKMIQDISALGRKVKGRLGRVNVTISVFTPKPHTPFQWEPIAAMDEISRKQTILRSGLKSNQIKLKFHSSERSHLEAVFCKGDRRLGRVLVEAWRSGCKFDAWDEGFDYNKWQAAFKDCQIDPEFYARRRRQYSETLPWNHIDSDISSDKFWQEREAAFKLIAQR